MSKYYVAVVNVSEEAKSNYYRTWFGKDGEVKEKESSCVDFLKLLYQKQGKYFLNKAYAKFDQLDYILFTGKEKGESKNTLCLLVEVTGFEIIEPVEVAGKSYNMECYIGKNVSRITNQISSGEYKEYNKGSLQHRVLEFASKDEVQKFLAEQGARLVTEQL